MDRLAVWASGLSGEFTYLLLIALLTFNDIVLFAAGWTRPQLLPSMNTTRCGSTEEKRLEPFTLEVYFLLTIQGPPF